MSSLLATRDSPVAQLAPWLRWASAAVFAIFGVAKFTSHATELSSFRGYGLPAPAAFVYAIGTLEIAGAALLAAGLLTRLAALALAGDMIGAIAVSGLGKGEIVSLTLAPALLITMLVLVWVGPGHTALDARLSHVFDVPPAPEHAQRD